MSLFEKIKLYNSPPLGDGGFITVIADDFTGAAELAGISLRYGLTAELCTGEVAATNADVLIVSTDSRSLKKEQALEITSTILKQVLKLNPVFIYKKIDSVLRGYVTEELKLQMQLTGLTKAFVLPANPSLGRRINNGIYYVQGTPIAETGFAADPEFPVKSSSVQELLNDESVLVIKPTNELTAEKIFVGEASSAADVQQWADKINADFVLAGAGDFYTALLAKKFEQKEQKEIQLQSPFMYVCGTAYDQSVNYVKAVEERLPVVSYLSKNILAGEEDEQWFLQCKEIINKEQKIIVGFDAKQIPAETTAVRLRSAMAKVIKKLLEQNQVKEVLIEGGSSAMAIFHEMNIHHLVPVNELSRGVVRMKAGELFITVKPGSYPLAEEVKKLFE